LTARWPSLRAKHSSCSSNRRCIRAAPAKGTGSNSAPPRRIRVDDKIVIPDKSRVRGTVTTARRAGRLFGRSEIHLRFDEIYLADGTGVLLFATLTRIGFDPLETAGGEDPGLKGETGAGGDAGAIIKGGLEGAVIGVMSAGPRGAAVGAAAGVAIAAISMIIRRGPDIDLQRNTMAEARFDQPLDIPPAAMPKPAPAVSDPPLAATTGGISPEEPISPPRPRLTRPKRDDIPPAENPLVSKPPENSPAAPPLPPLQQTEGGKPASEKVLKLSVSVRMVLVAAVVKDKLGHTIAIR
jgi:hypothetical protein